MMGREESRWCRCRLGAGGWGCVGAIVCVIAAMVAVSCAHVERGIVRPPMIEGAEFVGNPACADCHTNIVRHFPSSVHARFFREDAAPSGVAGCESCHGAGSRHIKSGGGQGVFIFNPGRDPQPCLECHREVHAEFRLPSRHPVLEGGLNCVSCHDPHGHEIQKRAGGLAFARLNQQCAGCHPEQTRPFVFEHEAMRDGCTVCHDPHGSVNDALLVQRDANLCLKCHSQMQMGPGQLWIGKVDHGSFLQLGTCWTAGCHTAVHGSMVNPRMLY